MTVSLKLRVSIVRDRVVLHAEGGVPRVLGRFVTCPECGAPTKFVESSPCPR